MYLFVWQAPMYYRGAVAAVIVVDIMNEESYADLECGWGGLTWPRQYTLPMP